MIRVNITEYKSLSYKLLIFSRGMNSQKVTAALRDIALRFHFFGLPNETAGKEKQTRLFDTTALTTQRTFTILSFFFCLKHNC